MLACPTCGLSAAIRIERATDRDDGGMRWNLHCADCGTDWSITDRA